MLKNYFKIAWRGLARSKSVGIINIFGLTVGITAALLLFVIVAYELGYDKFQPNYDHVYRIYTQDKIEDGVESTPGVANPFPDALMADKLAFDKVVPVIVNTEVQLNVRTDGQGENLEKFKTEFLFYSTSEYVDLFGLEFLAGAASVLDEPGKMVLSRAEAERFYGSWENAMGKSLELTNGVELEVGAVVENTPENSNFHFDAMMAYETVRAHPIEFDFDLGQWGSTSSNFQVYVLTNPATDMVAAQAQLDAFSKKHFEGRGNSIKSHHLQPLADIHFNSDLEPLSGRLVRKSTIQTLVLVGIFILVMASINFVNLTTSQAIGKSKEIGVRKVMGSSKSQIALQSLGETFLSVLISSVLALIAAHLLLPYLDKIADVPADVSFFQPVILAFMLVLMLGLTLLSGFYPALVISRFRPIQALKNKFQGAEIGGVPIRRGLVVMQFAIAQILMIGTLIAVRQMELVQDTDLGFNKEAIYYFDVPSDTRETNRMETLKQELLRIPGVIAATKESDIPSSDNNSATNFYFDQKTEDVPFPAFLKIADEDYFDLYEMEFVAGAGYPASDTLRSVVINETMAKKLLISNPEEAVGKLIRVGGRGKWVPISGVVKDFAVNSLREEMKQLLIFSTKPIFRQVAVKLDRSADRATLTAIQETFEAQYPEQIFAGQFVDETIAEFYESEQKLALVYKIFAGLAILISCIGLYGLVSFMIGQKVKEIGIRKVLGASIPQIAFMLSREFLVMVLLAFGLAIPLAYFMMKEWLATFAYQTRISIGLFVLVMLASLLITLLTVGSKAVRAALANPVDSLKDE
ncbi:ABC transporter permease [Algoriphagus sp. H41]|uniref:ABC transporter permease n=1 Tax=Algoriphagus oliviformis TaxID=2811231 RepID=A0ABS3C996_9BACT|nr:ABC transporter permease [Algoriphagus oliviformis]MBN7813688.1 ABC transporter permease [Algoriphagus oliviformis]